jgi:hypothetical protein
MPDHDKLTDLVLEMAAERLSRQLIASLFDRSVRFMQEQASHLGWGQSIDQETIYSRPQKEITGLRESRLYGSDRS